jgi:Flp pilus assembly pilin Flp
LGHDNAEDIFTMRPYHRLLWLIRCVKGQDMMEYALLAGFLAVSAGATLPGVHDDLEGIFRSVSKTVDAAATRSSPTGQATNR